MKTIISNAEFIYEINKSKFLAFCYLVSNKEQCDQIIEQLRRQYKDARHVCYAYVINQQTVQKYSDDKEPSGTAGFPMLSLLLKAELTDVLIVVVRYFGGIKLGAGGLLRAYCKATSSALELAGIQDFKFTYQYELIFNYDQMKAIDFWIKQNSWTILDKQFSEQVIYKIKTDEPIDSSVAKCEYKAIN